MGTGSLFFGFLFLINPDYFTFDLFPDLFGYLLIAHGLYRLSFLEDRIFQARRFAKILALISFSKLLANGIALTTNVESDRLTLMFLYAIVEGVMGFMMADNVFKGIQYLSVRMNSDLAYKGLDITNVFVKTFIIVKNVLSFMPAALILFYSEVDSDPLLVEGYASLTRDYRSARFVLTILYFVCVMALGVYTAAIVRAYIKRVRSDKGFAQRLADKYRESVIENENAQVRIHVRESFGYFLAAVLFLPDMYIDHVGLIPTFVAGVLVVLGLSNLSRGMGIFHKLTFRLRRIVFPALLVSFCAAVYRLICLILWEDYFQFRFWGSLPAWILGIAGGAASVVFGFAVLRVMIPVCRRETEVPYRVFTVFVSLLWAGVIGCSVFGFIFPGRNGLVQAIELALALVAFYLFWRKSDQIIAEVDYRRM